MIKVIITSVFDKARQQFINISLETNEATARRNYADARANPETMIYAHPDDYMLVTLGEMDIDTGVITQPEDKVFPEL
jgi:hypothetical protein